MSITRRRFVGLMAIGAALATSIGSLFARFRPAPLPVLHGDGVTDDTLALHALFSGERFVDNVDGVVRRYSVPYLRGGVFRVTGQIPIRIAGTEVDASLFIRDETRSELFDTPARLHVPDMHEMQAPPIARRRGAVRLQFNDGLPSQLGQWPWKPRPRVI